MDEQERNEIVQQVSKPLSEAKGWIKFLGVLSILGSALVIVAIAFMSSWMLTLIEFRAEYSEFSPSVFPILIILAWLIGYGAMIVLCIRLGVLLIQLSSHIEVAGDHSSLVSLEESACKIREVFTTLGIVAAIALVLYVSSYLVTATRLLSPMMR